MTRTLLHYPTIDIAPGPWLLQGLLYWDQVASIVPYAAGKDPYPLSEHLEWLRSEGQYRIARPVAPRDGFRDDLEAVVEQGQGLVRRTMRRLLGRRDLSWQRDPGTQIHSKKFLWSDREWLLRRGWATEDPDEEDWLRVRRDVGVAYMSLLAMHVANEDPDPMTPGTNLEEYQQIALARGAMSRDGIPCLSISLSKALPVPRIGTPWADIIRFKQTHPDELNQLREVIDEGKQQLSEAQSRAEAKDISIALAEQIKTGRNNLQAALQGAGIETVVGSASALFSVKQPAAWAALGLAIGKATNVAAIPFGWSVPGLALLGGLQVAYYCIQRRNARLERLRESHYSYLYHAEKEKLIE